jgi:nudix motif 8
MSPVRLDTHALEALSARLAQLERRTLEGTAREAAVLIPFCTIDGEASVLFTKRSDKVGTHKGQVSFPGGMCDADDDGPIATALRELDEELGVPAARVRVLGTFHDARAITGVRVVPVIGFIGELFDLSSLRPSEAEIDAVFALSVRDIVDPEKRSLQTFGTRGPFPVFDAGPFPVWGLTAFILSEVMQELFGITIVDTRDLVNLAAT